MSKALFLTHPPQIYKNQLAEKLELGHIAILGQVISNNYSKYKMEIFVKYELLLCYC